MKIRIRRSGGLAGFDQREEFSTESLAADQAAEAARSVSKLLAAQAAAGDEEPAGADMLRYEIEVEDGGGKPRKIMLLDDGSQPALAELLQAVGM